MNHTYSNIELEKNVSDFISSARKCINDLTTALETARTYPEPAVIKRDIAIRAINMKMAFEGKLS